MTLADRLTRPGDRLTYAYDFGDGWEHVILLEKFVEPEPGARYPLCVGGRRACPPEDCGGPGGYDRLRSILADPSHEGHDEKLAWLGLEQAGAFDPEEFDVEAVNGLLREGYNAAMAV